MNRQPQGQKQNTPARMPKAQALALLRQVKRGIVVASFLGFGTFSALVMSHTVGAPAQQTTKTTTTETQKATPTATATQKTTPTTTATTTPATPTATPQGGYGFGSNPPASNPVSGTHTS